MTPTMSPAMAVPPERLHQLFLLNLSLQLFDGVATYQGVHVWGEGNPLVLQTMPYWGTAGTLMLFKAKACGFLVLLRRAGTLPLVYESLLVLATTYTFFSFIPWMSRLLSMLHA